ncbi:MAG: DUF4097 family beta strand repeat protein [Clostridia bacterium]|nr:DUF4097 family beta strand repeat protein [Clostridia bacterium]
MNRNESFSAAEVTELALHLAWASVDIMTDDVSDIQVMISGNEADVTDLKLVCQDGRLLVEQPTYGLSIKLNTERWMQVLLRIPPQWKGALDANTISAPLKVRGISGTDLQLDTVSGDIRADGLNGITIALRSVSGTINANTLGAEKLSLRSVSGDITIDNADACRYKLNTVSGETSIDMIAPFDRLDGVTVSGSVRVYTPVFEADAVLRSVNGRLRTSGVSITEQAPLIHVKSVRGDLEINHQDI